MKYRFKYAPEGDKRKKEWNYQESAIEVLEIVKSKNANSVIWDVGANIMDHTIFFANESNDSVVYSFEPIDSYYKMGKKNISDYGLKNVKSYKMGIGSDNTKMEITLDNEASSIVSNDDKGQTEIIEIYTIDYLVFEKGMKPPTFLKIDVEGFGQEVLEGAKKTITKYKPIIMFEWHPHLEFVSQENLDKKIRLLAEYGYSIIFKLSEIEFVMEYKNELLIDEQIKYMSKWSDVNYRKLQLNKRALRAARKEYDSAKNKNERKKAKEKYKQNMYPGMPMTTRLIWSKLYCLFTLRYLFK